MNNHTDHNPWGREPTCSDSGGQPTTQSRPAFDRQAACQAGTDVLRLLTGAAGKCRDAAPRVRAFGTAWVHRTRSLWQGGSRSGKPLAVLAAMGGIAALVVFAYLAVILLPVMIFGAFVAAVLAGLGMRR